MRTKYIKFEYILSIKLKLSPWLWSYLLIKKKLFAEKKALFIQKKRVLNKIETKSETDKND